MSDDFKGNKKYIEAMEYRDWQTCDLICEEHKELVDVIKSLEQKLAKAVEGLKFYSNIFEYRTFNGYLYVKQDSSDVTYEEIKERAKQILKEIGESHE